MRSTIDEIHDCVDAALRRRSIAVGRGDGGKFKVQFVESAEPVVCDGGDGWARFNEFGERSEDLGSFGGSAHHDDRTLVHRDLLLHAAGVRDQERRFGAEGEEVAVPDRIDDGQPIE